MRVFSIFLLLYVNLCARSYDEIIASKVLKVAMRENSMTYQLKNKKIVPSFDYALALKFANDLGLKLQIIKVSSFKDYWTHKGKVIFNMKPPVTPDIFKSADMTFDIISQNPLREKYVDMIPYIENKTIVYSNKSAKIKKIEDLIGKRVIMFRTMQTFYLLTNILKQKDIKYKIFKCRYDPKNKKLAFYKNFSPVKNAVNFILIDDASKVPYLYFYFSAYKKDADAASTDTISLFKKLNEYDYLKEYIEPSFTLDKDMGYLCATMPKSTKILKEKLKQFLKKSRKNGFINHLMLKYINIDLKTYISILKYHEN